MIAGLKVVLFDMDGTLVQMRPAGRMQVLNETLELFNLPLLTSMEAVERFWFTSERYAMIDSWGIDRNVFWDMFDSERIISMQMHHTYAYEDVGDVIAALLKHGLRLGIVSNSAHLSLNLKLKLLEEQVSRHSFEVVVSCHEDARRSKPAPDGIYIALGHLGISPHEAILVGDSLDDIGAGNAAGVPVHIVNRGQLETIYRNIPNQEQPFSVLETLHELPRVLQLA